MNGTEGKGGRWRWGLSPKLPSWKVVTFQVFDLEQATQSVVQHNAGFSLLALYCYHLRIHQIIFNIFMEIKLSVELVYLVYKDPCSFPCLNGGQCVHPESCDCSLYQATGTRCQTVPNPGFEREMACRSWGQYNYETFDGLYYHFPGRCTYTLLRDCEDTSQASILIQVHNDPDCRSSPYSCTRSVSLFLPWEGEIRLHRSKVTFKGQSVQLPHHIHDVELEKISRYVLVTQQHGFTLAWDGHSGSVYIKLSPEWVGRTCGLCGNFNADVQDDLKTSYGVVTEDLSMFGNSWVEEELHQVRCPMVPFMFPSPCASRDPHILLKVEEVCAMLLEEPFTGCHEFVSPLSYMASCSNDLCLSGPNGDVVCQVFTEYARVCAHADHPLTDWRTHIPQCAMPCPPGLQYKECITCCPVSCNVDRMCIDNKLQCLDGCYCPDDLIYEEGSCVKASDCPCEYHGMVYPSGQTVQEECNNCTCVGGVWNCTEYSCPGECSVTGDMYFHSFDGRMFTFPASCQYVLAKSRNSGKFTVTIQNAPCGPHLDGSCIQSVSLVIDEDPRTEITLTHLGEVFMAGQYRISLPYSDEVFYIQELSSMYLQVRTALGLHLQYSWREFRLYLQVDELWKGDTVGLCGTFNGNIQDDFLSPSGMIESTPHLFGNTWRVSSACVPSQSVPQLDPCDTHQQAASYASEMCDILNQELFSACHEYLSPVPFHQQCKADTCKCGQSCLCSSLAHYARQCRKYSVITEFRSTVPDCEVTCPDTMEYGTCVSSCQRRCSALSMQQHCGEECEEGCVCPHGTFYSTHTHTCVPRSSCPCSFLGADYAPGDVIMTSAGVQALNDIYLLPVPSLVPDQQCPLGQMYLDCTEGLEGLKAIDGISLGRGLGCEHTCESHLLNLTCSAHEPCIPGCVCPPGLLKHGDECFEPDACPCLWKGKEYYPGDRVTSPCHQCVCQHGTFQCVFRPCPSMCTAYGDRHYRTFDGLLFDYVGVCKVYLVTSSADLMMSVTAENVDCYDSGVICRKSLLINIGRSFIAFDDDSGKPNPSSVIDWRQEVFIWSAGLFTVVHVPEEDLTVLWDRKTTVHIQAGPRWQGKLSGLCGNFDLRTVNEMRTPENIDSATPQEFGNSWTAAECVNSPDIRHPCSLNPLREPFSKRQCGVLLSEVFLVCHPVVDVTWFYMNCLADTCGCSRGGDCECFCTSVAAYAHRCCHQGVTVDWRSPSICRKSAAMSGGTVFPKKGDPAASDRPNYFLAVDSSGHLTLTKWEESEAFWAAATFTLHRDTWIQGYDSLEALARPGFFLHYMLSWIHLMKYKHTDGFRKATLFKLTDTPTGPKCQWRYESCVSPCFRTCSDPSGGACGTVPKVEGCLPLCPGHMVLDEVTQRCVHVEDCETPAVVTPVIVIDTVTTSQLTTTPTAYTERTSWSGVVPTTERTTEHTTTTAHLTEAVDWRLTTTTGPPTVQTTTTTTKPPDLLVTTTESPQITFTSPSISTTTEAVVPTTTKLPVSPVSHTETTTTTFTSPSISTTTEVVVPTTTILPVSPVSHTETTTTVPGPPVAVGTVMTQPPTTLKTTEPWRPPHSETSTTPSSPVSSTEKVTTPEVPVKPAVSTEVDVSPHQVFSTTTTDALHHVASSTAPGVTTTTSVTMTTTAKTTTAPPETSTGAVSTSRTERPPATPEHPAVPGVPGEPALSFTTTVPTTTVPPLPGVHTTTITPVPGVPVTTVPPLPGVPVTTVPPLPGVHTTTITPVPGVPVTTVPPLPGVPVTTVPPLPGVHTTTITPVPGVHTTTIPPLPGVPVTTVPPLPGVHTTTIPPLPGVLVTTVPPLPGIHTTTITPVPGVPVTTAIRPVTIRPLTETTSVPPDTGRVEVLSTTSTTTTQEPTSSWSGPVTTTSSSTSTTSVPRPTSHPERVTTRVVPTSIVVSKTTHRPMTTTRWTTTGRVPVTTSRTATTVRSTARPSTVRATVDTRTLGVPGVPTATTRPGPPTVAPPSLVTATVSEVVPTTTVRTTTKPIIDECTKFLCVSGQLVRFNMSQNCLYNSTPPNCGLLGFAILVNGDKCCPQWDCPCRCSVFPDLNVITFDGNSVAIYKATSYIVTQLPSETVSIVLLWNFTNLCLVVLNITHKSNHLVINRLQRRVSLYAKPRFKKFGFEILDTGNMYLIRTPAGLKLQWFHSTGMLVIETESYNSKLPTMGLCGCCDGNPGNDLMLSNGTTVGESEDPAVFIDSWQVPNTTSYISHSRRREVNCSTSDCSQCMTMLRNTSFSPCHAFVPPSTFCEVWVRDAEYVNNPCVALAAYVASCHKFNVCMEWRSPDYCPFMCPDRLRYQACLPTCTAQSCSNHDFDHDPEQCTGLTEGCVCPEGTLLHRPYSALCIPPEKCACTDSSGVPRAPGEVWKASKDGCCMYRCDNDSIVPVEYNCSAVSQPLCRRAGEVVIGLADDTSCCPQKACVCNQTLCDIFPPECQYGEKLVSYFREDSCCPDYVCECDPERCESDVPACREDQTLIATRADGSCCLAHICMCGSCLEVVPNCQDGEVLTVDANSTDLCCPVYHCVCEPYRCAELSCPLGMSAVTVSPPDHCCPLHTCGKVASYTITVFMYSTFLMNVCSCVSVPVFVCTPLTVREAVCVDGERGVMHPGQTLVDHSQEGVCLTTQCSHSLDPTTGFHLLRTATTNCSAQCQPNQIYIPPKDQMMCCGVCRNISCLYHNDNGTTLLYKPGKSWVSDCMKYDCTDTLSGPTLVSYSFSCPPFNQTECMKIGGTIVSYMDGCCKTCKEDGKSCQKVTVRMTIRKNDCRSNRPVNIVSCDGKCPSASIYNYNINTYARFCKCCREMGLQRRSVQLYCSGNSTWVNYSIQEPTDCSCQWS
uniref:Otogelin n=1 Tax=Oncorhynchus tshawytscha TaxID=74940 RepID=A0AAZ3SXK3_ONCTS